MEIVCILFLNKQIPKSFWVSYFLNILKLLCLISLASFISKISFYILNTIQHRVGPYGPTKYIFTYLTPLWSKLNTYTSFSKHTQGPF